MNKFIPKSYNYLKLRKRLKFKQKNELKHINLKQGTIGLKAIEAGRVTATVLEAIRRVISRRIKKIGQMLIYIHPNIALTKKPVGVRMGKGAGSLDASNSNGTSTTRGATGNSCFTMGDNTTASDDRSFAGGFDSEASGRTSFAFGEGNLASGFGAIALNGANFARSYFETTIGLLATDYTPNSDTANDEGDRIFTVGVGTFPANRSDGFTILKNGNTAVGINNFEANDTGEKLQVNGTVKASQLNLTGLPVHADEAAAVVAGLATGDVYMTATGELRIKL